MDTVQDIGLLQAIQVLCLFLLEQIAIIVFDEFEKVVRENRVLMLTVWTRATDNIYRLLGQLIQCVSS